MKVLTILSLIMLTMAISEQTQKSIETQKISPLQRALQNMAFLQQQSQQLDYSRLTNAIEELEGSIKESKDQEIAAYQTDSLQHDADQDFYNNQITQHKTEVAQHQVDLSDSTESRNTLQKLLDSSLKELGQTNDLKSQIVALMKSDKDNTDAQIEEYNQAIEAIDEALEAIKSVSSGSFIEKSSFQGTSDKLAKRFKKMKIFYQPLITAMTQISQSNFANQEMISKVNKLLQDLRTSLNESKITLITSTDTIAQQNQEILSTYDEKITLLNETLIPQLKDDISVKDGEIKTKQQLLGDAQINLQTAQDNLKAIEDAWFARQNENNKLISQYDTDIALIGTVKSTFERAGIKK